MPVKTYELNIGANTKAPFVGGINLFDSDSNMAKTDSPDCMNVMADEVGALICRDGQEYLYATTLGSGTITGFIGDYKGYRIIGYGTGLYKQQGTNQPTLISSGLSGQKLNMYIFNKILYIIDGVGYKQYDGIIFGNVTPYVPEITISRIPSGNTSTLNENLNLLTGQAIDSFSADGTSTVYQLSITGLNSIDEVKVNGNVVTTGFTTNLTNGTVTFADNSTDKPKEGTNNVKIKFTKNSLASPTTVYKNKYSIEYSGRIWLSGNPDYPNRVWRGGPTDDNYANYFPALKFSNIGNDQYAVTGFCNQYNKLIIFKEKSIYMTSELAENNTVVFPYQLLN